MTFENQTENWGNSGWEVDDAILYCELLAETYNKKKKLLKKDIFDKESTDIGLVSLREEGKKGNDFIDISIFDYEEMITSRYDY